MKFNFKKLNKDLWKDFQAYFEFDGACSGCWCMNHRLPMGLDFEGEAAKLAMKDLVCTDRVFGILAYVEDEKVPVGWCALDRRNTLPGHDCIGTDIDCDNSEWSIHCVTSRKDYKNKGVENFLVKAAAELAVNMNGKFVEGYPEPKSKNGEGFKTWNTFNGFESCFLENGFSKIDKEIGEAGEFYSVVKKELK
ncbi:MAG: hypothetical protein HON90_02135 [Halobacteriovoraceae bacterium]|jgi:hypothetical protein|nr:hypothetical protein [Halobacteriovoraceae bacterium]